MTNKCYCKIQIIMQWLLCFYFWIERQSLFNLSASIIYSQNKTGNRNNNYRIKDNKKGNKNNKNNNYIKDNKNKNNNKKNKNNKNNQNNNYCQNNQNNKDNKNNQKNQIY